MEKNCLNCKQVFALKYKKQKFCSLKCAGEIKKGRNNPQYKNGSTLMKYFCIDCNKEISYMTFYYGKKRCHSCATKLLHKLNVLNVKGENNPAYIDGSSKRPYNKEFSKKLREEIRSRDEEICILCGMTSEKHKIKTNKELSVHHIDYNKQNCKKDNLITLCQKHNIKVNNKETRKYWMYTFKNIIALQEGILLEETPEEAELFETYLQEIK